MNIKQKNQHAFTIVELLIVIVVIGILASISVAAYSGVQRRGRDAQRAADVAHIQRALELYRAEHGVYPLANTPTSYPSGYSVTSGYGYSFATDDTWLRSLVQAGVLRSPPRDPINNNERNYRYLVENSGRGPCPGPFYVLWTVGWEAGPSSIPSSAQDLNCSTPTNTAHWRTNSTTAVFSNIPNPS
jgi:prepilin-type N-terminal cleavage/methylation domain-containing protein